ncbi:hypothetical protein B0E46_05615 [Rhodanobacter sp. B04]|nr:hypothetical protein B0E46_05615 [Rhodanobacter sp. B04]
MDQLAPDGYADSEQPSNSLRPEKAISETALLLLAAESAAGQYPEVHTHVERVAQRLIPHARSERIKLALCMEPALALDYAHAHICLARLGYPDTDFDILLQQSVQAQAATGRERPPHRMLEQSWSADLWSGPGTTCRRSAGALARWSQLNLPMDLLNGHREDIYAFTHALIYCSRFNLQPLRLPRPRHLILAEAEGALARCLDDQDYDLAGELLLAWPLTGKSWSPAATFGFRVLAQVEDAAGFLPAPITRLDRLHRLQGRERQNYLLATSYHTVYVMGLLCAAALLPGRAPPIHISATGAVRGASSRIMARLDAHGAAVHWRDEFDKMEHPRQDAIAGLLLDIAMHRAVRQRDFAGLHTLLQIGYASHLADSPVASQVAEMLGRVATCHRVRPVQSAATESAAQAC